jgi:hypothetical protein
MNHLPFPGFSEESPVKIAESGTTPLAKPASHLWWAVDKILDFQGVLNALDYFCNPHYPLAVGLGIPRSRRPDSSSVGRRFGCCGN